MVGIVGKSQSLDFPTMLIFWSLVRNSVVLAVYLLFSVACFLTVHEHLYPKYNGRIPIAGTDRIINKGQFEYGIYDVTYWQEENNPTLILYQTEVNKGRQSMVYTLTAAVILLMALYPPAAVAAPSLALIP